MHLCFHVGYTFCLTYFLLKRRVGGDLEHDVQIEEVRMTAKGWAHLYLRNSERNEDITTCTLHCFPSDHPGLVDVVSIIERCEGTRQILFPRRHLALGFILEPDRSVPQYFTIVRCRHQNGPTKGTLLCALLTISRPAYNRVVFLSRVVCFDNNGIKFGHDDQEVEHNESIWSRCGYAITGFTVWVRALQYVIELSEEVGVLVIIFAEMILRDVSSRPPNHV